MKRKRTLINLLCLSNFSFLLGILRVEETERDVRRKEQQRGRGEEEEEKPLNGGFVKWLWSYRHFHDSFGVGPSFAFRTSTHHCSLMF